MKKQTTPSKTLNALLWTAQILLSLSLIWAGLLKLFQPVKELQLLWPWTGEVSASFIKLTGTVDLLGALGLLLPSLLRWKVILVPVAAIGVILLMIAASAFHISRGEGSQIGVNIVFALIAGFIAWGRFKTTAAPKS